MSPASSTYAATGSSGADGRTALERWERHRPDIVLLDLGLPDIDGLTVIRRIRREATTPIVILSGRYEEREKVQALERGADDYVTKPFGVDELNARLRVALRHAAGPAGGRRRDDSSIGPLTLDAGAARGRGRGERLVELTPREFEILRVLLDQRRAGSSRRAGCSARSGARRTRARTATSTSTSASSGGSSRRRTRRGAARPHRDRAGRRLSRRRAIRATTLGTL